MANKDLPIRSAHEQLHLRIQRLHEAPIPESGYVLYWIQQQQRLQYNFALQHALHQCREYGCGLVIVEDLLCEQRWNGMRHFEFAMSGMAEIAEVCTAKGVPFIPLVARTREQLGKHLSALVKGAREWITDWVPGYLVPELNEWAQGLAQKQKRRLTAVDSNGLLPIALLEDPCPTAAVFRRYVHKHAAHAVQALPKKNPWPRQALPIVSIAELPKSVVKHSEKDWHAWQKDAQAFWQSVPIDHGVEIVADTGGRQRGLARLQQFMRHKLAHYDKRSDPGEVGSSGLSPYLHWGQVSVFDCVAAVTDADETWDPARIPEKGGARQGFWPLNEVGQLFFDELITWRELSYHTAQLLPDFTEYDTLPQWARTSLSDHSGDKRTHIYSYEEFEQGHTHDALWNACQRQLREEGVVQNYLRMLWGKKILEWSASPEQAFAIITELNNRWCLDGRNPNSYAGITWCFGRYDRPWQRRDVFGVIRFMSEHNTQKKFDCSGYLARYGVEQDSLKF